MAKLHLVKDLYKDIYYPAFEEDKEVSRKVKGGEILISNVVQGRNVKLHRKLMKLFHIGFSNQQRFTNDTEFRSWILIKIGWCAMSIRPDGTYSFEAKSISFDCLPDEIEFEKSVYNPCVEEIAKMLNMTNQQLAIEVLNNF